MLTNFANEYFLAANDFYSLKKSLDAFGAAAVSSLIMGKNKKKKN